MDELQPAVSEYPGFMLSMNAEPQSFPDEVVKRSMMIYTTTALPAHDEGLRQRLQSRIQEIRRSLTGHLIPAVPSGSYGSHRRRTAPRGLASPFVSSLSRNSHRGCSRCSTIAGARRSPGLATRRSGTIGSKPASSVYSGSRPTPRVKVRYLTAGTVDGNGIIVWEPRDAFGRAALTGRMSHPL